MNKKVIIYVILFSIIIAVFASFFASGHPDGLEKVAEILGFIEKGKGFSSLFTDYSVSFISIEGISTAVAGIIGILLMYGAFKGIGILIAKLSIRS